MSQETGRRNDFSVDTNAEKVRKVIEDICKRAGDPSRSKKCRQRRHQPSPRQHLHITYTGEADAYRVVQACENDR